MALGLTITGSAPIQAGQQAKTDPILSSASLAASNVLLKMAAVPRSKRLRVMTDTLNAATPGLGTKTRADFLRLAATKSADQADQVIFDVVRAAIANRLVALTKAQMGQQGTQGLGSTDSDVRVGFCTVAGGTSIVGGFLDAFGAGGQTGQIGAVQSASATGGTIGGCNIAGIDAQTRQAQAQAQLAQSVQMQQLQMQQAQEARMMRYLLIGGGGLVIATVLFAVLKK